MNARERSGVTENRPEVEAIDGPEQRKKEESEVVKSAGVTDSLFLRKTQWPVYGGPHRRRRRYRVQIQISPPKVRARIRVFGGGGNL